MYFILGKISQMSWVGNDGNHAVKLPSRDQKVNIFQRYFHIGKASKK